MKQIKFIHCADLHLDSPMVGLKTLPEKIYESLRESTFVALKNLVDQAIEKCVDFIIIAGDIFDSEDRSIRAQIRFKKEMERLETEGISVYIVHGNHDHLNGQWTMISMPANVHIFGTEVERKRYLSEHGVKVDLSGFSYRKRHIYDEMINDYKQKCDAHFDIGILHGHAEMASEHSKYAPFTLTQLLEKNYDYWALGHIHKRQILHKNPNIVYPGNIQGRNRLETGEKGCYFVKLTEANCRLEWLNTADVLWNEIIIDSSNVTDFESLYDLCVKTIHQSRQLNKKMLVTLKVINVKNKNILTEINRNDLLGLLQEDESTEETYIYPIAINILENLEINRNQLANDAPFFAELFNVVDNFTQWEETFAYLYDFPRAQKHLEQLTKKEQDGLLQAAEQLVLQLLTANEN